MRRLTLLLGIVVAIMSFTYCESRSDRYSKELQSRTQVFIPLDDVIGKGDRHTIIKYKGDTIFVLNQFAESFDSIGYLVNIKRTRQ